MGNLKKVSGRVYRVRYQQGDFIVFDIHANNGSFVSVSGSLCGLKTVEVGTDICIIGKEKQHLKYGASIVPVGWEPYGNTLMSAARLLKCVVSSAYFDEVEDFDHITTAEFRETCGESYKDIHTELELAFEVSAVSLELERYELHLDLIKSLVEMFGLSTLQKIRSNPYHLVSDIFPFGRADILGKERGIESHDVRRYMGLIVHILLVWANEGHLYQDRKFIQAAMADELGTHVNLHTVEEALKQLSEQGSIFREFKRTGADNNEIVYSKKHFTSETVSALLLSKFIHEGKDRVDIGSRETNLLDIDVDAFISDFQTRHNLKLSPEQIEGLHRIATQRCLVVTGLPGTGKTLLLKSFVELFKTRGLRVTLMAPTGIAAKRLQTVTGHNAGTIHRTLKYKGTHWLFDENNQFDTDVVIVDEVSMVDQGLLWRLLSALPKHIYLVFVGDDAQLPSVAPGNVLREMLQCPIMPKVRLKQIFRQDKASTVVSAAHAINNGILPELKNISSNDEFQFVEAVDDEQVLLYISTLVEKMFQKGRNFQVISPMYKGVVGVQNLNKTLRDILNPYKGQKVWSYGSLDFRVGDRVIVLKNDYRAGLFNGDIGKIIDFSNSTVVIEVYGGSEDGDALVTLDKQKVPHILMLAYAITVHRSQGSEFDNIIFPVVFSQKPMLIRNLVYTALTRAKNKAYFIGFGDALSFAVNNNKIQYRNTIFSARLQEQYSSDVS